MSTERDELAGTIAWAMFGDDPQADQAHGAALGRAVDAILAAGYRKPKAVDHQKMWIENGWLVAETGRHDCAGGDEAAGYHHEPTCGIEPLEDLTEVLERSGYRKPRTVTTAAELDALPVGSVVMTIGRGQRVGKIKSARDGKMIVWAVIGDNIAAMNRLVAENILPATVLHEPA